MALKNSHIQTKCFPLATNQMEWLNGFCLWGGGLRCNAFHSANMSHMPVLQWPASAPIKRTYETLLMCTHLERCQLTEKTRRGRRSVGLRDSTQVSRHSHRKTRRTFNKLSSHLTCSTAVKIQLWLMPDDERTHGMCTDVVPTFVFFSFYTAESWNPLWHGVMSNH